MDNIFSVYVWNLSYYTSVNRKKLLDVTTNFFSLSLLNPNFLACCEVQEKTEKRNCHALVTQGMMKRRRKLCHGKSICLKIMYHENSLKD